MANFWKVVSKVIQDADILLLLLDSRFVKETRNKEIEDKIKKLNKPLIYVITKCDLVPKEQTEKKAKTLKPCVFVSAKKHHGTTMLRERILIEAKRINLKKAKVGVLGYPNVGKSSLINALVGKSSAPTSILSGKTKGVQKLKANNRILLLDTPGVIPYREKSTTKHAFIGTIDFTQSKEPDLVVMRLMEKFPGIIEAFYKVKTSEDPEETLEEITKKRKVLKKGGKLDTIRMARIILKDWQKGEIKII